MWSCLWSEDNMQLAALTEHYETVVVVVAVVPDLLVNHSLTGLLGLVGAALVLRGSWEGFVNTILTFPPKILLSVLIID